MKLNKLQSFFCIIAINIIDYSFADNSDTIDAVVNELSNDFVQYKQFNLKQYGNSLIKEEQIFEFSPPFLRVPKIIFGIVFYNNQDYPHKEGIDFHITSSNVYKENCTIKLNITDPPHILYGIQVMALAIDSEKIPNIKVSDLKRYEIGKFQIMDFIKTYQIEVSYSKEILSYTDKKVAVFLNGFKTSQFSDQPQMKIAVDLQKKNETHFLINVISKVGSIDIKEIYIQYIEYGEDEKSNFFTEIFEEQNLKTLSGCLSSSCKGQTQNKPLDYTFKTDVKNSQKDKILFGINQLDFSFGEHQKIQLNVTDFNNQILKLQYLIEDSKAKINGIQSTFIIIGIRKCSKIEKYYFKNACYDQCSQKGKQIDIYDVKYCGCPFEQYYDENYKKCQPIENKNCTMVYFPFNTCTDNQKVDCKQQNCKECKDEKESNCIKCIENYFHLEGQCFPQQPQESFCNQQKYCKKCKQGCDKCIESVDKKDLECNECKTDMYLYKNDCQKDKPINAYCEFNKCEECKSKNCMSCLKDKVQCEQCFENLEIIENKECGCKEGKYYNQNTKKCDFCSFPCQQCKDKPDFCIECRTGTVKLKQGENQTCSCQNSDEVIDENKECNKCPSFQQKVEKDGIRYCECIQPGQYFSKIENKCLDCRFKNCQKCNQDGESCQQCNKGFQKSKIKNSLNQCSFCNNGIYADENGVCDKNFKCKTGCIRCTNSDDCQEYKDQYIFKNKDCHFSCSECLNPSQYDCLKCSSQTRVYQQFTNQCPCKQGYKENEIEVQSSQSQNQEYYNSNQDCIIDKDISYESKTKQNRLNMINAVYFLYFTQLFINIHPFGDSFLFTFQILGNVSLLSNDRQILEQFTIFNYFNILYSNQDKQTELKQFKAVFVSYKTIIDKDIVNNIGILLVFYIIGLFLSLITQVVRIFFKIYSNIFQKTFLWNFQLKIIRISSNYLILNSFVHFMNISNASIFSNVCIIALLSIYIINGIMCFKKSYQKDTAFINFLSENLDTSKIFHRYYWTFIEIKKITLIIYLVFLNQKFYYYAVIVISIFSLVLIIKQKPGLNTFRDSVFLLLNELFLISISSIFIISENLFENNDISEIDTLRQLIDCIAFIFGLFQYLFCFEYQLRKWRQNKKDRQEQYLNKISKVQNFLEIPATISFQDISDILNQTSSQSAKYKLCSKNKLLSKSKFY